MDFENIYPIDFKKVNLLDRKVTIDNEKVLLFGVKGSGKNSILINHLREYKKEEFLYMDFEDERIRRENLEQNLSEFIKKNKIEILAIENFDYSIELPNIQKIFLTSNELRELDNFEVKEVFPLDFEEYILFDKRHQDAIHSFNSFLKDGSFPEIYFTNSHQKIKRMQYIIKSLANDEVEFLILKQLIFSQGFTISPFQIFTTLKKRIKLSKDRLYYVIDRLLTNRVIFFVEKYNYHKANKKLYLIDFTLRNALSFNKNFLKEFENMIFLELIKRQKELYFTDFIEFFLPKDNSAILTIPFTTKEAITIKIENIKNHLLELHIVNLKVVTISGEFNLIIENINVEVIPFWVWAIQD